jgi:hypothetical protein
MCGGAAAVLHANAMAALLSAPGWNLSQSPAFCRGTNNSGSRQRQMIDGHHYRQLGAELARRAQQIQAPELRLVYLGLAAGYDRLARFHERAERRTRAGTAEEETPDGSVSDEGSRED